MKPSEYRPTIVTFYPDGSVEVDDGVTVKWHQFGSVEAERLRREANKEVGR